MDFNAFVELVHRSREKQNHVSKDSTILCFDPGHTTGYAVFLNNELTHAGQLDTQPIENAVISVLRVMEEYNPDIVVVEDYRVYQNKAQQHAGSELLTARIIGVIETFCTTRMVKHVIKQPAHVAKGFCTNDKLRAWGFYQESERHANDAIRHGCYFILFGAIERKQAMQPRGTVG